jgi:hypothetical protein
MTEARFGGLRRASRHGRHGLGRPLGRDDRGRQNLRVVGLPLPGPKFVSRSCFNLDATWVYCLVLGVLDRSRSVWLAGLDLY